MSADDFNDVDAELLAMAGDSSDDDASGDEAEQTTKLESARSPSEEAKPSVEEVEEPAPGARKGVAQKVRKRGRKKVNRRELEDELNDLEDSPSPGSDAMQQSESDADTPASSDIDQGPLYPLDGKFHSEQERTDILNLPEIEREEILAERANAVLKKQQDLQLRKAIAEGQAKSKHKRKAAAADLEDSTRKTSRPKTEKASALDSYKKAREAKGQERTSRFDRKTDRRDDRSPSSLSDRDADGESEVEWAEPTSSSRRDRDDPPAELKDFDRCRIGRSSFAKYCFYPNFEETMKGCYARVSIGMNRETGQNMYRMTQIKGFTEGKPYTLETPSSNGAGTRTFQTDQYALVAHGAAEKPWPFSACSDSRFTADEYDRYRQTLDKEHIRAPKQPWLLQKLDDIHRFLDVKWTDQALQAKFSRQRAMEQRVDPANAANRKREAIMKRKVEAQESEDAEEVMRCDAELAALENNAATSNGTNGLSSVKAKPSPMKHVSAHDAQKRLAELNQRNRGKNADDVRKALIEERRKIQREREKAHAEADRAKAEMEAAKAEEEKRKLLGVPSGMNDLFGDTPDISRAGTPMSGADTPKRRSRAGTPAMGGLLGMKKEKSALGATKRMRDVRDDALDLDMGIDVEI